LAPKKTGGCFWENGLPQENWLPQEPVKGVCGEECGEGSPCAASCELCELHQCVVRVDAHEVRQCGACAHEHADGYRDPHDGGGRLVLAGWRKTRQWRMIVVCGERMNGIFNENGVQWVRFSAFIENPSSVGGSERVHYDGCCDAYGCGRNYERRYVRPVANSHVLAVLVSLCAGVERPYGYYCHEEHEDNLLHAILFGGCAVVRVKHQ